MKNKADALEEKIASLEKDVAVWRKRACEACDEKVAIQSRLEKLTTMIEKVVLTGRAGDVWRDVYECLKG